MASWSEAVADAVRRAASRSPDGTFTRQQLIDEEGDSIIAETGTAGQTPWQTLSRELQELAQSGFIEFIDHQGTYRLNA